MIQDPDAIPIYPRGTVRSGAGAITRFVERRLAARYGWNLEVLQGREPVFPGSRTGGTYRVLHPARYLLRPRASLRQLDIAEWLRFGNSIRQLVHVFALAERWGIRHVCLPARHELYRGEPPDGLELSWSAARRRPDLTLSGYFLHVRALTPPLDAEVEWRMIRDFVRPLVSSDLLRPDPRVGGDDLVLHFRSGDVFDPVELNRCYAQPPLAYYLAAYERERAKRVWLVFEDRRNPTIAAAEETLRSRGVDVRIQSGALADDLRVLLSARRLVSSIGTLLPAVALLSSRVETYYQFSKDPSRALVLKGVRLHRARDIQGDFDAAVTADWGARPEQLRMMVSYPEERIAIELAELLERASDEAGLG